MPSDGDFGQVKMFLVEARPRRNDANPWRDLAKAQQEMQRDVVRELNPINVLLNQIREERKDPARHPDAYRFDAATDRLSNVMHKYNILSEDGIIYTSGYRVDIREDDDKGMKTYDMLDRGVLAADSEIMLTYQKDGVRRKVYVPATPENLGLLAQAFDETAQKAETEEQARQKARQEKNAANIPPNEKRRDRRKRENKENDVMLSEQKARLPEVNKMLIEQIKEKLGDKAYELAPVSINSTSMISPAQPHAADEPPLSGISMLKPKSPGNSIV